MANISDLIENFIIRTLGEEDFLDLSRNDLAEFFGVAPSQINYVLATRFNFERGYSTTSKRGGGGYIRLTRLGADREFISKLFSLIGEELDYQTAKSMLIVLTKNEIISESEYEHLEGMMSSKTLSCPMKIENHIRAKMMKSLIEGILRRGE